MHTTYIPTKEQYLPSALTQPEFYLDYNVMVRIFWHTIQMSRNCNISNNSRGSVSLWLLLMVKPLPFGKFLQMCSLQFAYWIIQIPELSCRTTKIATSNDRNGITSKKPGTVLLMQNVDLGHTKVMQIRQRETLSHQGAITHEVYV